MNTMLDWISFSFPVGTDKHPENGWRWEQIRDALIDYIGVRFQALVDTEDIKHERGRFPYNHSASLHSGILRVHFSGRSNHALFESTGMGMAYLRQKEWDMALLEKAQKRVTRLDIASDIETTTSPSEFVSKRSGGRILANASFTSKMGKTEYVGGRTSQKFARVYRYNAPHPRSHLLRVEHEIKGDSAKKAASDVIRDGIEIVQTQLGTSFGWKHKDWQPLVQNSGKFKSTTNDRNSAKTEIWLRTQAATSFRKLVAQGVIENPEQWLREVFLNGLA